MRYSPENYKRPRFIQYICVESVVIGLWWAICAGGQDMTIDQA